MSLRERVYQRPLKRNLREQLVEQLGGDIVRGHLLPGQVLPSENVLLSRYDVSRTVLREALNVLSAKGLLDARPRRGTIVRPRADWSQLDPEILDWRNDSAEPSDGNPDHLLELRRIIEPPAAALAAKRATAEDRAAMARAFEAMVQAGSNVSDFVDADVCFHIACLHAARNEFLLPVAHAIRANLVTSMRLANADTERNRIVVVPLHKAILDAILARDAAGAREAMQTHLDHTGRRRNAARRKRPASAKTAAER
ncbi:MAG: FadR family transcriptional regulator [Acetobacteraceae bacterium]|nr:FadR family transcriptional regulator [Acetobacteraceae bacterium]